MPGIVSSTVWGIAPWSDELLKVSGDVGRGRRPVSELDAQLVSDLEEYERALEEASIDYRGDSWSGGNYDYLRDTVLNSSGFEPGIDKARLTRWFDTNTFYRQPILKDEPHFHGSDSHQLYEKLPGYQPTLLSPYAFARLIERAPGVSQDEADGYIGQLYDQLLDDAAERGVQQVLLHEPYAPYHQIGKTERTKLKESIGRLAANHHALEVGVYFSFGDASSILSEFVDDERVAAIGCDLQKTNPSSLPAAPNQRFLAGVIDGANTLIESGDEGLLAELAISVTGSPEISITHTVDLEHVPRGVAIEKIKQLGRLAGQYKERYE